MKRTLIALALTAGTSLSVQADTLVGLYAGAQGWNMETEGGFADGSTTLTNFNFDDETQTNLYIAFEHFVPLLPNIKVARTDMDTQGDVLLSTTFTFGGELFAIDDTVLTDVALTNTDVVLYYELFDNDLVSFDLGINAKYIDGSLFVQDQNDASNSATEAFSGVVPTLYSRVALGLPGTGLGVYAEGSFLSIDDHTLQDYQIALTYDLVENMAVDVDLQLGYRAFTLELEDLDDIYTDVEFKGAFAGIEVHF